MCTRTTRLLAAGLLCWLIILLCFDCVCSFVHSFVHCAMMVVLCCIHFELWFFSILFYSMATSAHTQDAAPIYHGHYLFKRDTCTTVYNGFLKALILPMYRFHRRCRRLEFPFVCRFISIFSIGMNFCISLNWRWFPKMLFTFVNMRHQTSFHSNAFLTEL